MYDLLFLSLFVGGFLFSLLAILAVAAIVEYFIDRRGFHRGGGGIMYQLTEEQAAAVQAAQDGAANEYWAYPNEGWQADYQSFWLWTHCGVWQAQSPDGLCWGRID